MCRTTYSSTHNKPLAKCMLHVGQYRQGNFSYSGRSRLGPGDLPVLVGLAAVHLLNATDDDDEDVLAVNHSTRLCNSHSKNP